MKKQFLKTIIFAFILLSGVMCFSQEPGDESDSGDLEDVDAPPAPIDQNIYWLAFAGLSFSLYFLTKNQKITKTNNY